MYTSLKPEIFFARFLQQTLYFSLFDFLQHEYICVVTLQPLSYKHFLATWVFVAASFAASPLFSFLEIFHEHNIFY